MRWQRGCLKAVLQRLGHRARLINTDTNQVQGRYRKAQTQVVVTQANNADCKTHTLMRHGCGSRGMQKGRGRATPSCRAEGARNATHMQQRRAWLTNIGVSYRRSCGAPGAPVALLALHWRSCSAASQGHLGAKNPLIILPEPPQNPQRPHKRKLEPPQIPPTSLPTGHSKAF